MVFTMVKYGAFTLSSMYCNCMIESHYYVHAMHKRFEIHEIMMNIRRVETGRQIRNLNFRNGVFCAINFPVPQNIM